ncbi:MAG: RNA polymerase sigma factor [Polyangiales bacterium]
MDDPTAVTSARRVVAPSALVDDAELVLRARAGDARAEEAIYRRHVRYLGSIALRLCGRQQDAEDIVQETFALALPRLDQLREPGALRVWLARVAVSQARRLLRRRRILRFVGLHDDDVPADSLCVADAPPEVRAELARVQAVLAAASPDERAAWWLHRVDGETLEATAEICDCSLATVKRRVAAAEARLARAIAQEERP